MRYPRYTILASVAGLGLGLATACTDGAGAPDAAPDADADAAPDAGGLCPGQVLFTGDYVDWDSSDDELIGVFDARASEIGNPDNAAGSAPNGRVILCLDPGAGPVQLVHPDYLTAVYAVDDDALRQGPFTVKGLTPARLQQLFSTELQLVFDPDAALVIVGARRFPGGGAVGAPAVGARIALDRQGDGAFTADATGVYTPGDTLTDDAFVVVANVAVAGGSVGVEVTAPGGACTGPATLPLVAGQLAVTTFACP